VKSKEFEVLLNKKADRINLLSLRTNLLSFRTNLLSFRTNLLSFCPILLYVIKYTINFLTYPVLNPLCVCKCLCGYIKIFFQQLFQNKMH